MLESLFSQAQFFPIPDGSGYFPNQYRLVRRLGVLEACSTHHYLGLSTGRILV